MHCVRAGLVELAVVLFKPRCSHALRQNRVGRVCSGGVILCWECLRASVAFQAMRTSIGLRALAVDRMSFDGQWAESVSRANGRNVAIVVVDPELLL